jgi:hypothetical protein
MMQLVWLTNANFVYHIVFEQQRPSLENSVRKELEFPTVQPSPVSFNACMYLNNFNFLTNDFTHSYLKVPSSAPSLVFRDTLPPTITDASTSSPTIGVDPLAGSSQPRAPVICTCSSTGVRLCS